MGLNRPVHVLVVTLADGVRARLAVERQVHALGWVLAWSPADADVLAVCGSAPGGDDVVGAIWDQLPGPRARVHVAGGGAPRELLEAAASLDDEAVQERLARAADGASDRATDHGDMGGMGPGDMGGMDHGDMGGMDQSGPAGIPLAGSSEHDRDGLEMDEWHVVLGAGLPGWPAGLVVRATLHGDLVTALETLAEPTGDVPTPGPDDGGPTSALRRPALLLDGAASVLELAGWSSAASAARQLRDRLIDGADPRRLVPGAERLARRVRRSLLLRWSLEGVRGRAGSARPGHVVRVRLLALLEESVVALREPDAPLPTSGPENLAGSAHLAVGQELGTLRLLVASLALDARESARA